MNTGSYFQWKISALENNEGILPPGLKIPKRINFLYNAEPLDCTINLVQSDYNFQYREFSFGICASCVFGKAKFTMKVCTSYDTALTSFGDAELYDELAGRFYELDAFYKKLSLPPYSFRRSAFPPGYNESQDDSLRRTQISRRDVLKLTLRLAPVKFVPIAKIFVGLEVKGYDVTPTISEQDSNDGPVAVIDGVGIGSAEGADPISMRNLTRPIMLDAFLKAGQSKFSIKVADIGDVFPLGSNLSLAKAPEVIQAMFNHTLDINQLLMESAAQDLQGSMIGVNYSCVETRKEWQPFLKLLSIVVGSTMGVFTAILSVIVMLARRIDGRKGQEDNIGELDFEDSRNPSTAHIDEGEVIPLTKIVE
ncbi:hypothetical protein PGTUg99_023672 [Puccinia graminis f. sp. tritici]|nr:hypothetical protein PGTUg99_023672 [Puccinia graminis f. sp. tritici]